MRLIPRAPAMAALALLTSTPLTAQVESPEHWRFRTDGPARMTTETDKVTDTTLAFVEMPPGWHVTMGPGGVLYEEQQVAEGEYTVESEIFSFPNSANAEFGFAVGGENLEGEGMHYVAFVVRPDGSVAAWDQQGPTRRMLSDWRRVEAVRPSDGKSVIGNVLKLTVTRNEAVLRVNGLDALVLPRQGLSLDGRIGLRVGKGINMHAASYTLTLKLAPPRR